MQPLKSAFCYNRFPSPHGPAPVVFMSTLPRSIDTDQDMPETIAATQPHQRPAPIKSWWQRENRTSEPCLMCVASEIEKTRGRRQRYFTICLHRHLANTQSNYCFHVSVYRYGVMYKAKKNTNKFSNLLFHIYCHRISLNIKALKSPLPKRVKESHQGKLLVSRGSWRPSTLGKAPPTFNVNDAESHNLSLFAEKRDGRSSFLTTQREDWRRAHF